MVFLLLVGAVVLVLLGPFGSCVGGKGNGLVGIGCGDNVSKDGGRTVVLGISGVVIRGGSVGRCGRWVSCSFWWW